MKILVAEGGSTKCDWLLITEDGAVQDTFRTEGFNPWFHTRRHIEDVLEQNESLGVLSDKAEEIYYFGAGCSSAENNEIIRGALKAFFENSEIYVDHDLTAAAYSSWTGTACISCILGTGSNSCFFDGKTIRGEIPSLAYILGDEGSGSAFGKRLLRACFYDQLPGNLREELMHDYDLELETVMNRVYRQSFPNVYLAGFMPFVVKHRDEPVFRQWIEEEFEQFFEIHVLSFEQCRDVPIHFVGSIAAILEEELREVAASKNLTIDRIIRSPGRHLAEFVRENREWLRKEKGHSRGEEE